MLGSTSGLCIVSGILVFRSTSYTFSSSWLGLPGLLSSLARLTAALISGSQYSYPIFQQVQLDIWKWSHRQTYSSNVHVAGTADAWAPVTPGSHCSCWHLDLPVHTCTEYRVPHPWKQLETEFDKASPRCSSPASQLVLYPIGSNPYRSLSRESLSHGFKMLGVPPAHRAEGLLGQPQKDLAPCHPLRS